MSRGAVKVRAHTRKAPKRTARKGKSGKPASKPAGKARKAIGSSKASGGKTTRQGKLL